MDGLRVAERAIVASMIEFAYRIRTIPIATVSDFTIIHNLGPADTVLNYE